MWKWIEEEVITPEAKVEDALQRLSDFTQEFELTDNIRIQQLQVENEILKKTNQDLKYQLTNLHNIKE